MSIETAQSPDTLTLVERPTLPAMRCGWSQRCPACGEGSLYKSYLKVNEACPACREELHHHRADDAPPYFTMLITGHIIIAGVLILERHYAPEAWVHMSIWGPLLLVLSLLLLPRVKGALVGLQWALRMHGFGDEEPAPIANPADEVRG